VPTLDAAYLATAGIVTLILSVCVNIDTRRRLRELRQERAYIDAARGWVGSALRSIKLQNVAAVRLARFLSGRSSGSRGP
jgi:hypothetical protein